MSELKPGVYWKPDDVPYILMETGTVIALYRNNCPVIYEDAEHLIDYTYSRVCNTGDVARAIMKWCEDTRPDIPF